MWNPAYLVSLGHSTAKIISSVKHESKSKITMRMLSESVTFLTPTVILLKEIKTLMENMGGHLSQTKKVMQMSARLNQIESIDDTFQSNIKSFSFDEKTDDPHLFAFTHSSSFVGNVRYDSDTQGMQILLNGKTYNFCNVSRRVYDAFEGANSKGTFFGRNIRGQFNC